MSGSSEDGEMGLGKQEVNGRDDDSETIRNENGFVHSIVDHAAQLKIQYELLVPHELELRSSGAEGVWTKTTIPRGTKYGPYIGKWLQKPIDMRFAWEVHVAERRGYLDGSVEIFNWLKFIRTAKQNKKQNIRPVLLAGQIYYETVQKVEASQELLLGSRMPLQMDTNGNSLSLPQIKYEDRSDQESSGKIGAQPTSGANDEEDKDYNDELRCFVCDKNFTDIDQLDRHFVTSHDRPADQFPCNHCPKKYSWESCLTQHKLLSHPSYQNFPCENCNKTFSDPSNLQRHIRTHHVGARSHACQVCGKTFATSSGLKQHTHIHSSVKPFRCEVCFKAYTQFSNLCRHKRMHSSCKMQIKCAKCNQSFSTNTSLTKHKRFCDSTPGANLPPSVPLPNMPYMHPQLSCNTNPYLNYPRPSNALPLYPPLLTHYQPIFNSAAAAAAAAGHMPPQFLANSLLFGQSPSKMFNDGNGAEKSAASPLFLHEMQKHHRRKSHTPSDSELNHSFREDDVKEEAKSPVDVKPKMNGEKMAMNGEKPLKRPLEDCNEMRVASPRKMSPVNLKTEVPVKRVKSEPRSEEGDELLPKCPAVEPRGKEDEPLDLSTRKEIEESADDQSKCSDREDTDNDMVDCSNGSDNDTSSEVNVAESTTDSKESPPLPTQDLPRLPTPPLPPTSKSTDSSMAYPRPIHPFLLDNFYRHALPNFAPHINSFGGRQLPLPNLPGRPFNFLGHLMNGIQNIQNGQSLNGSFEQLLRPPFVPFNNNTKPFPELPHVATAAKVKDRYACKFCGKVFPRSANLTRHLRTHTGEQPYKCKYCERSFSISSNLQRHVRNIHNKEKPFKCSLCDRCFGQQTNLDRHLRKHEAGDTGGIASTADSPESVNEAEPDAYFDEIRSFMGKVGYPGGKFGSPPNVYKAEDMSSIINPDEESEEDEDDLSDEVASHDTSSQYHEDSKTLNQSPSPISLCLNSKMESNGNMMNNNSQEVISTNI